MPVIFSEAILILRGYSFVFACRSPDLDPHIEENKDYGLDLKINHISIVIKVGTDVTKIQFENSLTFQESVNVGLSITSNGKLTVALDFFKDKDQNLHFQLNPTLK